MEIRGDSYGGVQTTAIGGTTSSATQGKKDAIVPQASTGGEAKGNTDIPSLPIPRVAGISLEQLMDALDEEERKNTVQSGLSGIKNKGDKLKALFDKKMEKIDEQLKKLEEKNKLSPAKKAFKWIGMILGAIASVASIVAGVVTANPLLVVGGAIGLAMSINSMVSEGTGGKRSIAASIAKSLQSGGMDEAKAQKIAMILEITITAVGVVASVSGGIASAVSAAKAVGDAVTAANTAATMAKTVASIASATTSVVGGAFQIAEGGVNIKSAMLDKEIANAKANAMDFDALMEQIRQAVERETDFIQSVMERSADLHEKVAGIVEDNTQAMTAILGGQPGMA